MHAPTTTRSITYVTDTSHMPHPSERLAPQHARNPAHASHVLSHAPRPPVPPCVARPFPRNLPGHKARFPRPPAAQPVPHSRAPWCTSGLRLHSLWWWQQQGRQRKPQHRQRQGRMCACKPPNVRMGRGQRCGGGALGVPQAGCPHHRHACIRNAAHKHIVAALQVERVRQNVCTCATHAAHQTLRTCMQKKTQMQMHQHCTWCMHVRRRNHPSNDSPPDVSRGAHHHTGMRSRCVPCARARSS